MDLARMAALDHSCGRERWIVKLNLNRIIISNFAVIVCCEKAKKHLLHLRK